MERSQSASRRKKLTKASKDLSDIVVYKNYARYNPLLERRETYREVVARSEDFMCKTYPELTDQIKEAFTYVYDKKVVPSMRMMQFAGKPVTMSPNRLYNCGFMAVNNTACFSEMMFLLLGGSGLGFSVERRHISKLPRLTDPSRSKRYMVQDSIVGWSDAVKSLMNAYFKGTYLPRFDFSDVREKGAPLKTSGGTAPGPDPLSKSLHSIGLVLKGAVGRQLTSVEIFDIMCYIAESVFAGGIRRAAMICQFDYEDEAMLYSKSGEWVMDNVQRCRANISVAIKRTDTEADTKIKNVVEICKRNGFGEPGILMLSDEDYGYNPCGEIYLEDCSFCNLSELVYTDNAVDMGNRLNSAALIGTLQAGFTDFFYLRDKWRMNCERNPLIGVSLTNICSGTLNANLLKAYRVRVHEVNKQIAEKIGINKASRVTCVKPSGSTSLVLGTSSGVHPWHAPYYIRTVEIDGGSPLLSYLQEKLPERFLERSVYNHSNFIVKFPIKAPEGAVVQSTDTLQDALDRLLLLNYNFIGKDIQSADRSNNVSCTLYMKTDKDWQTLTTFLREYRYIVGGVSMFPHKDSNYTQPVLDEITKEQYIGLMEEWNKTDINMEEVLEYEDFTTLSGVVACSGDSCALNI
jgi:ribonucleoside-triphosphate reductase